MTKPQLVTLVVTQLVLASSAEAQRKHESFQAPGPESVGSHEAKLVGRAQEEEATFPKLIYAEIFVGGSWPTGQTNVTYDPSFMAGGRGSIGLVHFLRVGGQLSFHSFDADRGATVDNQGVINIQAIGRGEGVWGPYRPYGIAGVGVGNSKRPDGSRRWDPSFQLGGGIELPVSDHFGSLVNLSLNFMPRGGGQEALFWVDTYIGFVFREP